MLRFLISSLGFYFIFCFDLRHSIQFSKSYAQSVIQQTNQIGNKASDAANKTTGSVMPNLPLPTPSATPTPSPTPSPSVSSAVISSDPTKIKKYFEFKSICLRDEENTVVFSSALKNKRINLLNTKLEKAQTENKKDTITNVKILLVREYLKQKNVFQAETLFKRDGLSFPLSDQAVLTAEIDIQKNLFRQAKNNLNKYLEMHNSDIAALEKLAEVYNLMNNFTEAKIVYEDLAKINIKKSYAEDFCQNAAYNAEHLNTQLLCEKLLQFNPKNHLAHIFMGISLRDQELYTEAIKQFEKSLKIKKSEFAATCLAESYYLNKNYDKAIEEYQVSIAIKPDAQRAYLGLASSYIKKNMYKEALIQFKQSCKLGLKPLTEMTAAANILRDQKSDLTNTYFDAIMDCKK